MKKTNKKITIMFLIIIFLLTNQIYAKYNYSFILDAYSLNRDISEIKYEIQKSVPDSKYTNQDVELKIISNKEIGEIEGFTLDNSRKILSKTVSQNEQNNVILEDLSGNKREVNYNISNIDKELPKIVGIEDGETYKNKKTVSYTDNIGIKDIDVKMYEGTLQIYCIEDYYDTYYYKGLDILGNQVYVDVIKRPVGTKYYKFYLNNILKATTEKSEYTFKGLTNATEYVIKVEALDENDKIIESVSKNVKTKFFNNISTTRDGKKFSVNITGINNKVSNVIAHLWHQDSNNQRKITTEIINDNRSLSYSFNTYDVNGIETTGYYYLHFLLLDSNMNQLETVCINVIFGKTYEKYNDDVEIDKYNFSRNGTYEIVVTDLAGNITKKKCIIKI